MPIKKITLPDNALTLYREGFSVVTMNNTDCHHIKYFPYEAIQCVDKFNDYKSKQYFLIFSLQNQEITIEFKDRYETSGANILEIRYRDLLRKLGSLSYETDE